MRQRLRGQYRPEAAHVLGGQVGFRVGPQSVEAAVQHRVLVAHAQHAKGEEGLSLHVSTEDLICPFSRLCCDSMMDLKLCSGVFLCDSLAAWPYS